VEKNWAAPFQIHSEAQKEASTCDNEGVVGIGPQQSKAQDA